MDFVHVGKTAGSTIEKVLHRGCRKPICQVCTYHSIPFEYSSPKQPLLAVVVSARDPIDRLVSGESAYRGVPQLLPIDRHQLTAYRGVSAFNWRHPSGGGESVRLKPIWGSADAKEGGYGPEAELYHCFADVNSFAEALTERSYCGVVARRNLYEPIAHIGKGLQFYLQTNLTALAKIAPVFLVRQEQLDKDLGCLFDHVFPQQVLPKQLPHVFDDYPKKNDTRLSPKARATLEELLATEYWLLDELDRLSVC